MKSFHNFVTFEERRLTTFTSSLTMLELSGRTCLWLESMPRLPPNQKLPGSFAIETELELARPRPAPHPPAAAGGIPNPASFGSDGMFVDAEDGDL